MTLIGRLPTPLIHSLTTLARSPKKIVEGSLLSLSLSLSLSSSFPLFLSLSFSLSLPLSPSSLSLSLSLSLSPSHGAYYKLEKAKVACFVPSFHSDGIQVSGWVPARHFSLPFFLLPSSDKFAGDDDGEAL